MSDLKVENTEKDFDTFLTISVHLTGFKKNDLLATGMHETYYYTLMKEPNQENVKAFLKTAHELLKKYPDKNDEADLVKEIGLHLVPPALYFELAKRIILLWYTGIWTSFRVTTEKISGMVSPQTYEEGLIWSVAETHPAGAKQPGYGSWEIKPF